MTGTPEFIRNRGSSLCERAAPLRRIVAAAGAALALITCSPAFSQVSPSASAAPAPADEVMRALEAAQIGNLILVDELLRHSSPLTAEAMLLRAQRAAALLREDEAREALARYFAAGDVRPARVRHARQLAAGSAFFAGRYAEAAAHASRLLADHGSLTADEITGMERLNGIARLLSAAPVQRLETRGSGHQTATIRDRVGLIKARIATGAAAEEAIIDTGANLSVASASAARRLGLRMLDGDAAVGNSLGGGVGVRLAIADRLELSGAVLRNVVFLVMEDAALTFPVPGGYRIDVIVGLPVLRALGRISFGPGETLRVLEPGTGDDAPSNLRMIGSSLYAVVAVAGNERPFFFDTGANSSVIAARFAEEQPALRGVPASGSQRAGAGGTARVNSNRIERVAIRIGGVEGTASELRVETQPTPGEERRYGVLGADLLRVFESATIDFRTMRLEVGRPLGAARLPDRD
jgi:hypothetical protein